MALPQGLILGIENSNPDRGQGGFHGEAVLAENQPDGLRLLAREPFRPASERDDDVMAGIDRAFRGAGRAARDLQGVCVSVGPGGFTGLRIATVTAKALAEATGALVFAVPTAAALVRRVDPAARAAGGVAVCLAWKGDTVWCARYGPGAPGAVSGLCAFDRLVDDGVGSTLVADSRLVAALRERGVVSADTRVLAPVYDALAVIEGATELSECDPVALAPLYPREPEAVTKWRLLHTER